MLVITPSRLSYPSMGKSEGTDSGAKCAWPQSQTSSHFEHRRAHPALRGVRRHPPRHPHRAQQMLDAFYQLIDGKFVCRP